MKVVTLPGVFSPISDSWMLADALRRETLWEGARVLDVCTGSGALAVCAAKRGARNVTAVDVSRRAVMTAAINARLNGVRVCALRGRLFEPVAHERFDCIVSNPPYVPSTSDELPRTGASRAWEAGRDGRVLLDQIIDEAPEHLRPNGVLLVTHSTLIGEEETLERMRAAGLHAEVVERRRGLLGPLMQERKREGVIPEHVHDEEVLIVRGQLKAAKSGMGDSGPLRSPTALA